MTIIFSLNEFLLLSVDSKMDIISFCLRILGNEHNSVVIDNVIIQNRDNFFNWQIENQIVFPVRTQ
jgi:hypothetical protein